MAIFKAMTTKTVARSSVYRLYHHSPNQIKTHHKSLQCTSFHRTILHSATF